jgi:hypothetical protein
MANALTNTGVMDPGRIELKSYRVTLPLESLSIGVDNIHHDVFLSPKFVQVARDYLFDLIRQKNAEPTFPGSSSGTRNRWTRRHSANY